MKLLFVLYNSSIGGAQKSLLDWIKIFNNNKKFKIFVIIIKDNDLTIPGVNISYLNAKSIRSGFLNFIALVRKIKPDISFTTMYGTGLLFLITKVLMLFNFNYIYREATNISRSRNFFQKLLTHLIILFSKRTTFNSFEQKEYFYKIYKNKIKYIPNYVPPKNHILKEKNKGIIMVGRSNRVKQFEIGLTTVLKNSSENIIIFTTSDDIDYVNFLKDLIKENNWNNRATIFIDETSKEKIYSSGDILIFTSAFEGNPNVLLEAILWRVGIVSLDIDYGPREIFKLLNINGLLNKNEIFDKKKLINIIEEIRNTDRESCYNIILNEYGPKKLTNNLFSLVDLNC